MAARSGSRNNMPSRWTARLARILQAGRAETFSWESRMSVGVSFEMTPQLEMRPSAALVAQMELLALPAVELEQVVERELASNPALERVERSVCPGCGRLLSRAHCPWCARAPIRAARACAEPSAGLTLAAEPTPRQRLLVDVRLMLDDGDHALAEYLVGNLDEHGFLESGFAEAAVDLGADVAT